MTIYDITIYCKMLNLTPNLFALGVTSDCLAFIYNYVSLLIGDPNLI